MEKVILVGAFHETVELCQDAGKDIIGIIDNTLEGTYYNIPIIGTDNDASKLFSDFHDASIVLVPDPPHIRKRLFNYYNEIGFKFATVVSPTSKISSTAKFGLGCLIQHGVNVSAHVNLGDFVKLNTCANVMHDCKVNDFATIAPNAVLLGSVFIDNGAFIGANATLLPGKKIGCSAIVGAGAVVTKDVEANVVVAGNPARFLKNK